MLKQQQFTPEHLARLAAWVEEVHAIAQRSDAALATLVDEEICHKVELTWRQLTILQEVQDRLEGLHHVQQVEEAP